MDKFPALELVGHLGSLSGVEEACRAVGIACRMDFVSIRRKHQTRSSRFGACQRRFVATRLKYQTLDAPLEAYFVVLIANIFELEAVDGLGEGCDVIEVTERVIRQAIGTSCSGHCICDPSRKEGRRYDSARCRSLVA